ncbi:hypothetical protein DK150_370071 [Flavobacterium psychrophilum]|uniref:hypothetical protein n=1 Tax=Flavobacterium psychrophilum TaxID=96345 RepID=UPI000B7C1948|nr:hypothetical protein [Flavobacterium psychrophilum]SNA76258.1 hypothetical protein DK150_370071 [Flavobacterium psychrophilum]
MNTKPITEYSQNALIDIAKYLKFSEEYEKKPVIKPIYYEDFESIGIDLITIFNAIEFIGYNGNSKELGTCAGLVSIAQKLLPLDELRFLDSLLIKKENSKEVFNKISDL